MTETSERLKAARERDDEKLRAEGIDPDAPDEQVAAADAAGEPEPEPEPAKGKRQRKKEADPRAEFDRIVNAFRDGLKRVLEHDGDLEPVPMEGAVGFMLPGFTAMRPNEKFKRCPTCNGHGQVLTGALQGENATADCPGCAGRGYLERLNQPPQPQSPLVPMPTNGPPQPEYGVPAWMGNPEVRPGTT